MYRSLYTEYYLANFQTSQKTFPYMASSATFPESASPLGIITADTVERLPDTFSDYPYFLLTKGFQTCPIYVPDSLPGIQNQKDGGNGIKDSLQFFSSLNKMAFNFLSFGCITHNSQNCPGVAILIFHQTETDLNRYFPVGTGDEFALYRVSSPASFHQDLKPGTDAILIIPGYNINE
jgi:hypothetical protein